MQKGPKLRPEVVWSLVAVVLLALLPLFACGGEEPQMEVVGEATMQAGSDYEVSLPPALPALEGAEESVKQPSEVTPPREVSYEEAEAAFAERRYDEAAELFRLYSERKPANPWGYYMLGLSAWKSGDRVSAEDAFETALELNPGHVKSWLNLARVLLDEARADEALEKVEEALALDPGSGVALRLQGRVHHQLGQTEEAIDAYRQAILIDDRDAWSMNNMGLILIEEERFEEALPALARAVEIDDGNAIFHNNLGIALERTGHYRAAEDAFKAVLGLDDTYAKAELNLQRVETLLESPELLPVDLAELARSFEDEVAGWREGVAYREWPDEVDLEPIVVSAADTTSKQ
ncbi:MAG: tetratricopeptide repeat protein [Gemmatimonadota bacterium]|nr:MAG: tetratricopeptide repeat protein [Gemmatimonadota bacterium]